MSPTPNSTLRLKLTVRQSLKMRFLPAVPGSLALAAKVSKSGDVMTGALTLSADPTVALQAATKQYVDSRVGGAPASAEYITSTADATLSAERVLTDTATITWDRTVAGQIKATSVAGGGNVSNSGTPTVGQYGKWVTATTIQGVSTATVLSDIGAQPLDADLTSLAAAAATNAIYYRSAANTWATVTIGANLTFVAGTLAATTSGTSSVVAPQGRLTLQSLTPVMATTQAAKTTIYYSPYHGSQIPLYDGANMVPTAFTEMSVATTDTTKNPAAIGVSKVNDWFIWPDSGTLRIVHGPDWTSDTARSAGTALIMINGILLNNASITNGPAAQRGTYVGTTRSNASSQLDWILGSSAAGGGAALLNVWNCYNRVSVATTVTDNTSSWTQASVTQNPLDVGGTGSGLNNRISFVSGLAEDSILVGLFIQVTVPANGTGYAGVALDSSSTIDKWGLMSNGSGGSMGISFAFTHTYAAQLGYHFVQAMQRGDGTFTSTYSGDTPEGFYAMLRM